MEKETGRSQKQTYTYDRKSDLAVKKKKRRKGSKNKTHYFCGLGLEHFVLQS